MRAASRSFRCRKRSLIPGRRPTPVRRRDFAANQNMVLWPYFDFKDPRWNFGSRYITLSTDLQRGPTKIGLA